MKKIFSLILILIPLLSFSQVVQESFAGYAQVQSVSTTPTDTTIVIKNFAGNPRKFDNAWLSTDIAVGDILWASSCSRYVVKSRTGLTLTVSDPDKAQGSVLPTNNSSIGFTREVNGLGAVPQFGDGAGGAVAGTSQVLAACIMGHYDKIKQNAIVSDSIKIAKNTVPQTSKCLTNYIYSYPDTTRTFNHFFIGDSYVEVTDRMTRATRLKAMTDRGNWRDAGAGYGCFGGTPPAGLWFSQSGVTSVIRTGDGLNSLAGKAATLDATGSFYNLIPYTGTHTTEEGRFNQIRFWTLRGAGFGTLQIKVDGVVNQSINTATGSSATLTTITGLSDNTHTIEFISTSGVIHLLDYVIERTGAQKNTRVWNFGSGGATALNWRVLFDSDWDRLGVTPNLVSINLGTNDKFAYNLVDFKLNLQLLLGQIKTKYPSVDIQLLGIAKTGETQATFESTYASYNAIIKQIASDSCYSFVDIDKVFPDWTKSTTYGFIEDLVHPSPTGGGLIANEIQLTLKGISSSSSGASFSGTNNNIAKFSGSTLADSKITDDNTTVTANTNTVAINSTTGTGERGVKFNNNNIEFGSVGLDPANTKLKYNAGITDNTGFHTFTLNNVQRARIDSAGVKIDGNVNTQSRGIIFQNGGASYSSINFTPNTGKLQYNAGLTTGFGAFHEFTTNGILQETIADTGATFKLNVSGINATQDWHFITRGYGNGYFARKDYDNIYTAKNRFNQPLKGAFGSVYTGGTDWNNTDNIRAGIGDTLLRATATNSMGANGSTNFFHPFNFEFGSTKDGSGNTTTLYIPYSDNGSMSNGLWMRGKFNGTIGNYYNIPTVLNSTLANGSTPVWNSTNFAWDMKAVTSVQSGTTAAFTGIATASNGTPVSVTFSTAFATTPKITLTPSSQVFCWITAKSASGFTCNCRNDSGASQAPTVDWIATQ